MFDNFLKEWINIIDIKELKPIIKILDLEYKKYDITPSKDKVFKSFLKTKYKDLKVIIIGQDPYPQRGLATGLAFANPNNINEEDISPSLKIIKESCINYEKNHFHIIFDNSLETWANQGVLLLNSSLTTRVGQVGSHISLWRPFVIKIIQNLGIYETGIIYVLLGKSAQSFEPYINKRFNHIIKEKHPSYYARIGKKMPYSLFEEINKILINQYGKSIKWFSEY